MTQAKRKKPIAGLLQVTGVILLMVIAFVYSREPSPETNSARSASPQPMSQAVLVDVMKPIASSGEIAIKSTGSVTVRSYVDLASQVSGRVVATSNALRNGGRFTAGETLVRLDKTDFALALNQVQADVTSAQAALELSQAEASVDINSYKRLHPGKEVPALIAKVPQIAQAKAQLQAATARRDIAQVNLERSAFSLPFAGAVVESSADEGQILTAGQSFGRAYALDAVEIVISLAPQELAQLMPVQGRAVTINADGATFEGRIDRVAAERNSRTQFSQVFINFDTRQPIKPGTFVTVLLNSSTINNIFMLPDSAIQVGQTLWIAKDSALHSVSAKVIGRNGDQYIVEAFDYADGIVIGSVPGAREGMAIRLPQTNAEVSPSSRTNVLILASETAQ
ncbi:efflux RND transporter periplasmic adaptor subunit [Glaciecola sp. SC05]|uniref:efflux RND transporter periplasmic adaptor subunit n=1 Tax=Glaciecola sp. SC05 TaxID=1987355 RepID=UPI003527F5F6